MSKYCIGPAIRAVASAAAVSWKRSRPFEHAPGAPPAKTRGTVRFLGATLDGLPAHLNFTKGLEHLSNIGASHKCIVDVTDLRGLEPPATLGHEGVEWLYSPSCLSEDRLLGPDPDGASAFVRTEYFDECAAIVKERTSTAKVVPYNYRHRQIREDTKLDDPYNFSGKPLPNIHMDNDEATAKAIVNLWRPVGDVVRQWPLVLVDASNTRAGRDTRPVYTLGNYKTHFTALKPQERYGFYYISNLAPDEAILFIDYDSQLQQAAAAAAAAEAAKIRTATTGRFQALRTARSRTIMPLKRRYGGG
ncbi:hypothetical protein GGTG_11559 [Gaeumannomyces tritici R3-111a-1]|uniref:Uncharacterized protein n=1 Tax=Gaeumannomyces tritici (strain R3-111a-1) TaxID=644352 RepID=J3PDI6_GAET3|nr:hypothetical protein GGTG_11559 [Gaeumannomyces tritici R3-111a-1]EJT70536.1 hypothetical protein GGTG_11559 [Gaeumannomyces tritici R3-111a-1]